VLATREQTGDLVLIQLIDEAWYGSDLSYAKRDQIRSIIRRALIAERHKGCMEGLAHAIAECKRLRETYCVAALEALKEKRS
jgi:hypothetical protein